jgi:PucR C-terminal helix-turn-helix domain/GGDEF-like domain
VPRSSDRLAATIEAMRGRRAGLEEELLVRIYGISDPTQVAEQEYVVGLRAAASVGVDYSIDAMEAARSGAEAPHVPAQLLVQAHLAARNDVSLDTVLRRYCSGNTIITDTLVEESGRAGLSRGELKGLLRSLAGALDRLLQRVSEEYTREAERRPRGAPQRPVELASRLLAGELLDASELRYSFEGWHLGFICSATNSTQAARAIADDADRSLLLAAPSTDLCWAWLGGYRAFDREEVEALIALSSDVGDATHTAFGEPAQGIGGWRLSHRQAASALTVARRSPTRVSRYSEVSLIASALQDELLGRSLRQLFLEPLGVDRDQGRAAKQTLRAYFEASRNVTSTAAALGVSRRTVANRLAAIERRLGRPLNRFAAEIETAIRLEELECH